MTDLEAFKEKYKYKSAKEELNELIEAHVQNKDIIKLITNKNIQPYVGCFSKVIGGIGSCVVGFIDLCRAK